MTESVPAASFAGILRPGLAAMDLDVSEQQVDALARYLELMAEWNAVYNLTGLHAPEDMVRRHILDSLTALPFIRGTNVLDVGTGAGVPGLPLALFDTGRRYALLDSNGKKARFVTHVIADLRLGNVEMIQSRVEDFHPAAPFDTVICRAWSSLETFVRSCGSLTGNAGRLVAMKGRLPADELEALPDNWTAREMQPVDVPGLDAERHIVVLQSMSQDRGRA